jgi:hypothetical protein
MLPQKAQEEVLEVDFEYGKEQNLIAVPENLKEQIKFIYGKERETCSEAVEFFLTNAHTGISGLWISALNSFCFSLALSGVDDTIIWETVEAVAPDSLDKRDEYQIKRAIRDGKRHRETD